MVDKAELLEAAAILGSARRVAALTGAGVSAESGVPTFRGDGGFWKGYRAEDVATPEAFARDPRLVWEFYNFRRELLFDVQPNPAHRALVELENRAGDFTLITQNVDGLHRRAGSRNVLEVHGNLWRVRCTGCARIAERRREKLSELPVCETCGALLRPDVVWFGETLPEDVWSRAVAAATQCDCLIVAGTSAVVYPAAGLVHRARGRVIEVNLDETPASGAASVSLLGKAGEVLPELVRRAAAHGNG
jgi:NAD-dependent deacetylase